MALRELLRQQLGSMSGLQRNFLGGTEDVPQVNEQQQLAHLLGDSQSGAANMAQQAERANAQLAQAEQAAQAQRQAQENATAEQAAQAERQRQAEDAAKAQKLLSLGVTLATGGLGGSAEAAAGNAGAAAAESIGGEMMNNALSKAAFTPEALGIAIQQTAPDILNGIGWGSKLKPWF